MIASARSDAEHGAVMFLVAITALLVMLAGAIAVDLSALSTRGQSLQNAADSAALAGVQAYRASMGERTEANDEDKAVAIAAVNALLAQNGIDLTPEINFPDPENDTLVQVVLNDPDAGFLLSGFTGGKAGTVERAATARFEACETTCSREVDIPPPFNGVDASGDGDGYQPIPANGALYSINHQSGNGRGSLQITCVLRGERPRTDIPTENTQLCWDDGANRPVPGKTAYPSNWVDSIVATPEMPHAAVIETRIYWATSTSAGHYMFCFETTTATPCSQPLRLNTNRDGNNERCGWNPTADPNPPCPIYDLRAIHRGGGTVAADGRVYSFTDDHMVHCVLPSLPMTTCSGYPRSTTLGTIGFPANLPSDGNHGSSIDRIVDEDQGRIYSTLHIENGEGDACPQRGLGNLDENQLLSVRNRGSVIGIYNDGVYLEVKSLGPDPVTGLARWGLVDSGQLEADVEEAHWELLTGVWDDTANGGKAQQRVFAFRAVVGDHYLTMPQGAAPWNGEVELSRTLWADRAAQTAHSVFIIEHNGVDSRILSWEKYNDGTGDFRRAELWQGPSADTINLPPAQQDFRAFGGEAFDIGTGDVFDNTSFDDWVLEEVSCIVEPEQYGGYLSHSAGTYLNCHEIDGGSCSGFEAVRLHADGSAFSGRLFFHRDGSGGINAICSTGFNTAWQWLSIYQQIDYSGATELTCVDDQGNPADSAESDMAAFRNELAISNSGIQGAGGARWGTWGDPHWNEETNRLFYPTHRTRSKVLCWDFDSGACTEGISREGVSPLGGTIQDYGFFSEGNCVFGLGHNAIFYAFKANDTGEKCDTVTKTTWIEPCNCGGNRYWGTLEFDINEEQFEEFLIVIENEAGEQVYPPTAAGFEIDVPPHNLLDPEQGNIINLSDYPVEGINPRLQVLVTVKSKPGIDPWAEGTGSQTFTIEIGRTPRLTD